MVLPNHLKEVNQTEDLRSHVERAIEKYMATEKPHYPKKEARHPLPDGLETWNEDFEFEEFHHAIRWGVCYFSLWHAKGASRRRCILE